MTCYSLCSSHSLKAPRANRPRGALQWLPSAWTTRPSTRSTPGASACCVSMLLTAVICSMRNWSPTSNSARQSPPKTTGVSSVIRWMGPCWKQHSKSGRTWMLLWMTCDSCVGSPLTPHWASRNWVRSLSVCKTNAKRLWSPWRTDGLHVLSAWRTGWTVKSTTTRLLGMATNSRP